MWAWDRVFSNCLQKMALTLDNEVPLPENIQAYVSTTLSGAETSHRVNGIAIQAKYFGPNLPPPPGIGQARTKKRSIDPSAQEILAEARKKNLLWILVRLDRIQWLDRIQYFRS